MSMTRGKGAAFLLKILNDTSYCTVAGLRTQAMTITNDNSGEPAHASIRAAGIFLGSSAENQIRHAALSGTVEDQELSFEDGSKLRGKFLIKRLDYSGDFNGERNYSLELESVGKVEVL